MHAQDKTETIYLIQSYLAANWDSLFLQAGRPGPLCFLHPPHLDPQKTNMTNKENKESKSVCLWPYLSISTLQITMEPFSPSHCYLYVYVNVFVCLNCYQGEFFVRFKKIVKTAYYIFNRTMVLNAIKLLALVSQHFQTQIWWKRQSTAGLTCHRFLRQK